MSIHQKLETLSKKGLWSGAVYALREISLIVIGVLIAVWIDNWNDNRKDRVLEIKTLQALKAGLQQDSMDIHENLKGLDEIIVWRTKIIKVVEGKIPLDSLSGEQKISSYTYFLNNLAPYENLKSVGLAKIMNDTLRTQIITLYELDYKSLIRNEGDINQYKAERMNQYSERAAFFYFKKNNPENFVTFFKKEKNFIFDNFISQQNEIRQQYYYERLLPKLRRLMRNIEKECSL